VRAICTQITAAVTAGRPVLVGIDVIAEGLSAHDLDENRSTDYVKWANDVPVPMARAGAYVVLDDHLARAGSGAGFARGTGAKRGKIDGAAYELRVIEPIDREKPGKVELVVQKDRHGQIGQRDVTAVRLLTSPQGGGRLATRLVVPFADDEEASPLRRRSKKLVDDMHQASRIIEERPGCSLTEIEGRFSDGHRARPLTAALAALADDGWIDVDRPGPGKSNVYGVLIPYRPERDPRAAAFSPEVVADYEHMTGGRAYPAKLAPRPGDEADDEAEQEVEP
jgi:hypothetical protein